MEKAREFQKNPSNEHPGLISLRMDWLDLLVVQGPWTAAYQASLSIASSQSLLTVSWRMPVFGAELAPCLWLSLSHLPFGERTRDCSPGHAGEEGPQLARTGVKNLPAVQETRV